jgi:hypothetical protein
VGDSDDSSGKQNAGRNAKNFVKTVCMMFQMEMKALLGHGLEGVHVTFGKELVYILFMP